MSCTVSTEYLNELLNDKTTVSKMPKIFLHAERLLDQGMATTRQSSTVTLTSYYNYNNNPPLC